MTAPAKNNDDWKKVLDEFLDQMETAADDVKKNSALLQAWLTEISYEGFDPLKTYQSIKVKGGEGFVDDVIRFCTLLVVRGSKMESIIKKMEPANAASLISLQKKYSITDHAERTGPETITLGRVGSTFPLYCGLIANELAIIPKIGVDWTVMPMAFGIPQMAACFPKSKNGTELLFMLSYVVREFDRLIHGAEADNTKARRFQRAQFNSRIASDETRTKWCKSLKFLTPTGGLAFSKFDVFLALDLNMSGKAADIVTYGDKPSEWPEYEGLSPDQVADELTTSWTLAKNKREEAVKKLTAGDGSDK